MLDLLNQKKEKLSENKPQEQFSSVARFSFLLFLLHYQL